MKESAEQPGSAALRDDLLNRVDRLAWLIPSASSLAALARLPLPDVWSAIRHDPAAVLLVLRQPGDLLAVRLDSLGLFDGVLNHLDEGPYLDWNREPLRSVHRAGVVCASFARQLAERLPAVDPEQAWCCGLLASLGEYAVLALGATSNEPLTLARRLARRWELPTWLTSVCGQISLPPRVAVELGADPTLFHLTRLAIFLTAEHGFDVDDPSGDRAGDIAALGLLAEDVNQLSLPAEPPEWTDPRSTPLLRDLLAVAAENRRLRESNLRRRTESEVDQLHAVLELEARELERRLEERKLSALAEFAAGAGHEINNPLAVISGQAQHLQRRLQKLAVASPEELASSAGEGTPVATEFGSSLQTIINQTKRIHTLLRELMQFARPAKPRPLWIDLLDLVMSAARELQDLAAQRHVQLDIPASADRLRLHVDPEQVRSTLFALIRNAVEAAPAEGWARVTVSGPTDGRIVVAVEDSGPGPDAAHVPHLFDPFFSGRSAGRGRGLGLPLAWRLARLHGGEVRLDSAGTEQPTRFVLELPWSPPPEPAPAAPMPVIADARLDVAGAPLNSCQTN